METQRQKKIGNVLQKDLVDILQGAIRREGVRNLIISISKVSVTTDLSVAKVYVSIFPSDKAGEVLNGIVSNTPLIKHELAQRTRHQLRRVPELSFFIDDSLDYIETIERSLKEGEDPIKDTNLLDKRNKA